MGTHLFNLRNLSILLFSILLSSCRLMHRELILEHIGENRVVLHAQSSRKYLLLPIEEAAKESKLNIFSNGKTDQTIYVHLALSKIDYWVPLDLSKYTGKNVTIDIQQSTDSALCWKNLKLSDTFDVKNTERFRPVFHHTPLYGWMNDPNGMVYLNGEYHLFYQYNPYGSMWGNMHWGHAVSKDLVNWKELPIAIAPDSLGSIFSGSCVIDKNNTSGFGKDAMVAFYTSAGKHQAQSMAYSIDGGRTFTKYAKNPILTSTNPDFRDPKVFWYANGKKWIMVLAVGQEIQIYSSNNMKEWKYESSFGKGQGAHGGVWECPDLIQLPIDGNNRNKKWVLICNINPGGIFGGSATQYFVGDFDGKTFKNESEPSIIKWMDFGKDHYATVTWNNAPEGRHIALAWMNNWQYANNVPTMQFRSSNSIPRDLSLYTHDENIYLASTPSPEMESLRKDKKEVKSFQVKDLYNLNSLLEHNAGAYELNIDLKNISAEVLGFKLFNSQGESVDFCLDEIENKFSIDRTKSGITNFSKDFATVTSAPIEKSKNFNLRIFVDRSSIECFGNGGKFAMTNLVFPNKPYNRISFYAKGGIYNVDSLKIYTLR